MGVTREEVEAKARVELNRPNSAWALGSPAGIFRLATDPTAPAEAFKLLFGRVDATQNDPEREDREEDVWEFTPACQTRKSQAHEAVWARIRQIEDGVMEAAEKAEI